MQTTLKQRVEELMKDVKIENPNEFSTYIGMKRGQLVYDVLSGKVINSQTLVNFISNKFQKINPEWISRGIEPKEFSGSEIKKPDMSQAEINEIIEENKKLKADLLRLSLRLNELLDNK